MTAPIFPEFPKDCLKEIFSFILVLEREKLKVVCKLFQKIVLDSKFTVERNAAQLRQADIAKVASQYPKALVEALGGPKALYALPVVDLTPKDEREFFYGKLQNPSRGKNQSYILLKIESTIPGVIQSVMIKKENTNDACSWIWKTEYKSWLLSKNDFDYIQRLFQNAPCGYKGKINEADRLNIHGQSAMTLYKKIHTAETPPIAPQPKFTT